MGVGQLKVNYATKAAPLNLFASLLTQLVMSASHHVGVVPASLGRIEAAANRIPDHHLAEWRYEAMN
jgi:hypothetical protein